MRPVVILYAKAPEPGRVKTRLARSIGDAKAASLHKACVADMIERLIELTGRADVELHTDVETDAWGEFPVTRGLQPVGDLGGRMHGTLAAALKGGRPVAAIVGSDAPGLPRKHVETLLDLPEDIVLGPTEDGGYWGIAARRVHRDMFDGVKWSSGSEREQTLAAARSRGLRTACGPVWWDVDTVEDLRRLRESDGVPARVARWMGENAGLF